jgi:hypothetical protein
VGALIFGDCTTTVLPTIRALALTNVPLRLESWNQFNGFPSRESNPPPTLAKRLISSVAKNLITTSPFAKH